MKARQPSGHALPVWMRAATQQAPASNPIRAWQHQVDRRVGAAGPSVLIVEDDPVTRDALVDLIDAVGYSAAAAAEGKHALAHLRLHGPPELILLDLTMPGMTGWAFRLELEQDPALARIPIVVCSGHGNARAEAISLNAADLLLKPIEPERLLTVLHRYCRRTRPLD